MKQQPKPKKSKHPAVWGLVLEDMVNRNKLGVKRYKTPLRAFNGRDSLQDLYEELLDACAYIRQCIYEKKGK